MKLKHLPSYIRNAPKKLRLAWKCLREPYFKWVPPGHFYSPVPDMKEVEQRANQIWPKPPLEIAGIDLRASEQAKLLSLFEGFRSEQPFERDQNPQSRFYRPNGSFPYQDAFVLYAMIRHIRPRRLIEVGCGSSSAVILDTCEALKLETEITFVEPHPEWLLRMTRAEDAKRYKLIRQCIQDVGTEIFQALEAGDVLFIDTSHVSKAGSDVNDLFFRILPALKPGVFVHFHDIWYPFEYPRDWFLKGMFWNEAYLLRALLMYNPAFEIRMFNSYLNKCMTEHVKASFPLFLEDPGGSVWVKKVA
jgi:predicted O-methyltransferase YrrM